ncbi:hypothetical protein H4582DRAFT_1939200 [Lactarius indigo]|nr:hypothetical protein H4582DRAFT_1939200 [Lactarius indigo]
MALLRSLSLHFLSTTYYPIPPPWSGEPVVLAVLSRLNFRGNIQCLEVLVAEIGDPCLGNIDITNPEVIVESSYTCEQLARQLLSTKVPFASRHGVTVFACVVPASVHQRAHRLHRPAHLLRRVNVSYTNYALSLSRPSTYSYGTHLCQSHLGLGFDYVLSVQTNDSMFTHPDLGPSSS